MENVSLDSLSMMIEQVANKPSNSKANQGSKAHCTQNRGLRQNVQELVAKHIKMMEGMTMEDVSFQQRVLQRMMELTK